MAAALALRPGLDGQLQLFEVLTFLTLGSGGFALGGWVSPRIRRPPTTGVSSSVTLSEVLAPALPFAVAATLFFVWPDWWLPAHRGPIHAPVGVPIYVSGASSEIRFLNVGVDAVVVRAVGECGPVRVSQRRVIGCAARPVAVGSRHALRCSDRRHLGDRRGLDVARAVCRPLSGNGLGGDHCNRRVERWSFGRPRRVCEWHDRSRS